MNVLALQGSPRKQNTEALCKPFIGELESRGASVTYLRLADMQIHPCRGCYACQQVTGEYGCAVHDDMYFVIEQLRKADLVVLATPIFTWYCTGEMKAMLDRLYGMNKFYGSGSGTLWKPGVRVAIIATHGYEQAYACDPFRTGIERLCEHSHIAYAGLYSVRDLDDLASFVTPEAVEGARAFARGLSQSARAST